MKRQRGRVGPWGTVALVAVLISGLVALAPRQVTGDAIEYLAMAGNLSRLLPPSLAPADVDRTLADLEAHGYRLSARDLMRPPLEMSDGRYVQPHFWLYPAMVAPVEALTRPLGGHPLLPFIAVNLVLLLTATAVLARRLPSIAVLLLVLGPIVWWVDKAQVEVLTFALGCIGLALVRDRPSWALLAGGAVAAQFPPFGIVVVGLIAVVAARGELEQPTVLAGAAGGLLIAAAHPLYYLASVGVVTPLAATHGSSRLDVSLERLLVIFTDLNIGMLFQTPFLVAALVWVLVESRSRPARLGALRWLTLLALPVLLVAFSAPDNYDHGGTPGLNRWLLLLLPLAVPWFAAAAERGAFRRRGLTALVALSCLWSLVLYRPAAVSSTPRPATALADLVWARWPALDHPLPEIFGERTSLAEPARLPSSTDDCSKVLLVGASWPVPCVPREVPLEACRQPGALCYANWAEGGYRYRTLRENGESYDYVPEERTWPAPQASLGLAAWSLAAGGLECDRIADRLEMPEADCRQIVRQTRRVLNPERILLPERMRSFRDRVAGLLASGVTPADLYAAAAGGPHPDVDGWLQGFAAVPPVGLAQRRPGDAASRVLDVGESPWSASLEDDDQLLLYLPGTPHSTIVRLDLDPGWMGAMLRADDGSTVWRFHVPVHEDDTAAQPVSSVVELAVPSSSRDWVIVATRQPEGYPPYLE